MDYILLGAIVAILGFLSVTGASKSQHGGKGKRTTKKHDTTSRVGGHSLFLALGICTSKV